MLLLFGCRHHLDSLLAKDMGSLKGQGRLGHDLTNEYPIGSSDLEEHLDQVRRLQTSHEPQLMVGRAGSRSILTQHVHCEPCRPYTDSLEDEARRTTGDCGARVTTTMNSLASQHDIQ